ncbi:MAG: hypothetical protein PHT07_12885 [Paludibacter sp.]|nr:hypothetical protein [Paludibacter sp.]
MTVIANIDISTPTGRKIVRELEKHKRVVQITYPEPIVEEVVEEETISLDEAEEYLWNKLEESYGVDLRTL